ncbi:hypothetical protein Lser_V15G02506 [Lactuca serriola]
MADNVAETHKNFAKAIRALEAMVNVLQRLNIPVEDMEAMINVLQTLNTPVENMESELQKLKQKQDEEEEEKAEKFKGFCQPPPPPCNHQQPQLDDISQQNQEEELGSKIKVDIPVYKGNLNLDEFCGWMMDVTKFFEVYEIPENEQVEVVANRLEEGVLLWWEEVQNRRQKTGKQPIKEWREMEKLLMDWFLVMDYDRFLFKDYHPSHADLLRFMS